MFRSFMIVGLFMLAVPFHVLAEDAPFSTAIIVYEYSGGASGRETIYFDKANNRINEESTLTWTMGGQSRTKQKRIMFDKQLYTFNFDNQTVISEPVNNPDAAAVMLSQPSDIGPAKGVDQVLDRECQVHEGNLASACFWNGLLLKESVVNTMSEDLNFSKEAVDIQIDVPIPAEKFTIDSGMRVLDPKQAIEEMQEMFRRR